MEHADGHRYFEGLAVAHVLGGLDDSEGRVFRAHLLECSNCRARVGELRAIAHDLADVERDERRVRAAQAIDTKRRESEDEVAEPMEQMPSPRSSRITVIVGLVLIMGLSLWNFTLRSALTLEEGRLARLETAAALAESGQAWDVLGKAPSIEGSVKSEGERFVLSLDQLDPQQTYRLSVQRAEGSVTFGHTFKPEDGRLFDLFPLAPDAHKVIVTHPVEDGEGEAEGEDGAPTGVTVFEALKPTE